MTIQVKPLSLPLMADPEKFNEFGRVVTGVNPAKLSESEFKEIEILLYKVSSNAHTIQQILPSRPV
jgi:xanthine dioxygenase